MALYVGLMSGTSCDGIDAALVEVDPSNIARLVEFYCMEYTAKERERLLQVKSRACSLGLSSCAPFPYLYRPAPRLNSS
jgi:anhydro-N-acetylmuramic acid kinase